MSDEPTVDELFDLTGDVAVVTGGSGQLGGQMCDALAEAGAHVVVAARTLEDCEQKARELREAYRTSIPIAVDVTDPTSVESMVERIEDELGTIDVLVNGAYSGASSSFEEMSLDEWNAAIETALTGTFLCCQKSTSAMRDSGGGRIINIGSIYGSVAPDHRIYGRSGLDNPPNYGAAKAGVVQLTRWLAAYLAGDGIRANCITPGGFYNQDLEDRPDYADTFVPNYEQRTPMGRMGDSTDLKGAVVFLASRASKWVTGENLFVDGGWTIW